MSELGALIQNQERNTDSIATRHINTPGCTRLHAFAILQRLTCVAFKCALNRPGCNTVYSLHVGLISAHFGKEFRAVFARVSPKRVAIAHVFLCSNNYVMKTLVTEYFDKKNNAMVSYIADWFTIVTTDLIVAAEGEESVPGVPCNEALPAATLIP